MKTVTVKNVLAAELEADHAGLQARYERIAADVESGQLPDSPAMQEALGRMRTMLGQISRGTSEIRGSR